MNIPELGPIGGSRNVVRQEKTERPAETTENTQAAPRETEETRETPSRDVFSASEDRQRIDQLVESAARDEEVRSERVEQARQRVESGYYDSEEFMGRLALRITMTGEG